MSIGEVLPDDGEGVDIVVREGESFEVVVVAFAIDAAAVRVRTSLVAAEDIRTTIVKI